MSQLRQVPAFLELIDTAKADGADTMATLLTHVGWNEPDGLLSIHRSTSAVGRDAFAAIGFPDIGRTDTSIRDVLRRAVRWSFEHGYARVSSHVQGFIYSTWSDPVPPSDDVLAESGDVDESEVETLGSQLQDGNFAIPDQHVTAKTRGSAQRVFADRVKKNYGWQCALTGIATPDFLVASHIVPWSEDESIRLDPANGICLSTFVDRAFVTGFLLIHDDCTSRVDWEHVGPDVSLRSVLGPFDGQRLTLPASSPPNPQFLRRRLSGS